VGVGLAEGAEQVSERYSGKPAGLLTLHEGVEKDLDARIPAPKVNGREDRMVYLNVRVRWKITDRRHPDYYHQVANLRVEWDRAAFHGEPVDETAFGDYTITPIKDSFLITHLHWERGQAGRGGKWRLRLDSPHATGATVATRYAKGLP
jgi:hypothetical protein